MQITVMSYNIKGGLWKQDGLEAVAQVIEHARPEIVALQEVDRNMPRSGGVDQPAWLAGRLGYHAVFACATPGEEWDIPGGEYGIAILSHWPISAHDRRLLFRPGAPQVGQRASYAEQRAVLGAAVETPGGMIDVFCTHLGLTPDQRLIQAAEVAGFCRDWHRGRPHVLMGDFNASPDTPEIATLRGTLIDVFERHGVVGDERLTFPSGPLGARTPDGWAGSIDYIFVSSGVRPLQIDVVRETEPASDHAPVVATLELMGS